MKYYLTDKFFRDNHGKIIIAQKPNIPIIVWIVCTILGLFTSGTTLSVVNLLGTTALIVWSILEIFLGVNYFRRMLGIIVLAYIVYVNL